MSLFWSQVSDTENYQASQDWWKVIWECSSPVTMSLTAGFLVLSLLIISVLTVVRDQNICNSSCKSNIELSSMNLCCFQMQ